MKKLAVLITTLAALLVSASAITATKAGSITGVVWLDVNYNGVRDVDEQGAANVGLTLAGPAQATAVTGSDGSYTFGGLQPDTYSVTIVSQPFFGTSPKVVSGDISQSVTLTSDAGATLDFGIVRPYALQRGVVFINGVEAPSPAVAGFVGSVQCAFEYERTLVPPHTSPSEFILAFVPPAMMPGCELSGEVRFTVNGTRANETAAYPPGGLNNQPVVPPNLPQPAFLELTVGPRAAIYTGERPWKEVDGKLFQPAGDIRALIGGVDCGEIIPSQNIRISVLPAELRAGCGTEGAVIDFFFGDVKTNEILRWTPGFHDLALTVPESELFYLDQRYKPSGSENAAHEGAGVSRVQPPDTGDAGIR